mmetsp:Transcript_4515/g.9980  ORF Transcript_4515/g.9980 Transcript_4515/m.9980 type:complete len:599 (-) Transcript_4515:115-1911(-)
MPYLSSLTISKKPQQVFQKQMDRQTNQQPYAPQTKTASSKQFSPSNSSSSNFFQTSPDYHSYPRNHHENLLPLHHGPHLRLIRIHTPAALLLLLGCRRRRKGGRGDLFRHFLHGFRSRRRSRRFRHGRHLSGIGIHSSAGLLRLFRRLQLLLFDEGGLRGGFGLFDEFGRERRFRFRSGFRGLGLRFLFQNGSEFRLGPGEFSVHGLSVGFGRCRRGGRDGFFFCGFLLLCGGGGGFVRLGRGLGLLGGRLLLGLHGLFLGQFLTFLQVGFVIVIPVGQRIGRHRQSHRGLEVGQTDGGGFGGQIPIGSGTGAVAIGHGLGIGPQIGIPVRDALDVQIEIVPLLRQELHQSRTAIRPHVEPTRLIRVIVRVVVRIQRPQNGVLGGHPAHRLLPPVGRVDLDSGRGVLDENSEHLAHVPLEVVQHAEEVLRVHVQLDLGGGEAAVGGGGVGGRGGGEEGGAGGEVGEEGAALAGAGGGGGFWGVLGIVVVIAVVAVLVARLRFRAAALLVVIIVVVAVVGVVVVVVVGGLVAVAAHHAEGRDRPAGVAGGADGQLLRTLLVASLGSERKRARRREEDAGRGEDVDGSHGQRLLEYSMDG